MRRPPAPRILVQCADHGTLLDIVTKSDPLCVLPRPELIQDRNRPSVQALLLREGLPGTRSACSGWPPRRSGTPR